MREPLSLSVSASIWPSGLLASLAFWLTLVQSSKLPSQPLPLRLRSGQRRLHRRELRLQQRLLLREQVVHAGDLVGDVAALTVLGLDRLVERAVGLHDRGE